MAIPRRAVDRPRRSAVDGFRGLLTAAVADDDELQLGRHSVAAPDAVIGDAVVANASSTSTTTMTSTEAAAASAVAVSAAGQPAAAAAEARLSGGRRELDGDPFPSWMTRVDWRRLTSRRLPAPLPE